MIRWPPYPGFSNHGIPHPPGGYCAPTRCYCGACPGYEPLPPIQRIYPSPAERASTEARAEQFRKTWDERDEPTWIDKQ